MAISEKVREVLDRSQPLEGALTKKIERQTAKIPSIGFLGLAAFSVVASAVAFSLSERKEPASFIGQWAPVFLLIGIYNKLVKLEGSDAGEH